MTVYTYTNINQVSFILSQIKSYLRLYLVGSKDRIDIYVKQVLLLNS